MLRDWAERYGRAVEAGDEPAIRGVGAEMFAWLDQGGALEAWMAGPERALEVCVAPTEAGALADALLAAPWEVLADGNRVLAEDAKLFSVARRCAEGGAPQPPQHRDLSLMFMAAAPAGQHDLDYEREEAAILAATAAKGDRPPLAHLQVEESGALEFLAERLTFDGPFEALHISCHGDIAKDAAGRPVPVLLLETDEGGSDEVAPTRLTEIRGLPPLVFLSACRTAEQGPAGGAPAREGYRERGLAEAPGAWSGLEEPGGRDNGRRKEAGLARDVVPELADPYVRQLAGQVANVIGWDGSVYDVDATAFAEAFYGAVVRGDTVPVAAARARKAVLALRDEDPRLGRHWHLARVYLGPGGGGAICDPLKPKRQAVPPAETVFLDDEAKLVPVARPAEFVGRRRAIQRVIRAYRTGHKGVVVHGMGNLGKSSLAARVAGRLRRHKTVAVFGAATERTMFQALARAGRQIAADMALSEGEALREELTTMERVIGKDRSRFGDMVQTLFDRVFDTHPVLLVLDDFEQSLVTPTEGGGRVVPRPEARAVAALLRALAEADTAARLLVTTRFDFAVPDGGGGDLAAPLARVPLAPMEPRERRKQVQAKARAAGQEAAVAGDLTARALAAAGGNPGLQDVLTRPLLTGNAAEADAAIAAIEWFRAEGAPPPPGDDLGDFFQRMAFETYTSALSGAERRVLGAATLFEEGLPVPRTALAAAAGAGAVSAPEPAIDRLLALGLLDDFGPMSDGPGIAATPHLAANPLARPLGAPLAAADRPPLAAAALAPLAAAWRHAEGHFPYDRRGLQAATLALAAEPTDPTLLDQAAKAAVIHLYDRSHNAQAALVLGQATLARLEALGEAPGPVLTGKLVNAAERLGEAELQERLLTAALTRTDLTDDHRGQFLSLRADREITRGDIDAAEASLTAALALFERTGDRYKIAITKGRIADILTTRGDLDAALEIRRTEQLPVFEALGDRRSIAVTEGQIADILTTRGELDAALEIRRTEQLPVYEALGDRREIAVTKGKIADILTTRGELDAALEIRQTEQLPVFEALGDRREIAVTQRKIGDILFSRGRLDEARQRFEIAVSTIEPLDAVRDVAVFRGRIADILTNRGDLDAALEIRRTEELPVYEALGDRRSIAVTKGRIADILTTRGDLDAALEIRRTEELPVYEALGDRREIAVTKGQIADILAARGEFDAALEMHLERLPIAREMGDLVGIAHVRFSCAQIRLALNEHETGGLQTIYEELAEAFAAAQKLQRPDAIGPIGSLLGQILAVGGKSEDAVAVLTAAAAAFQKIGRADTAAEVEGMIRQIEGVGQ